MKLHASGRDLIIKERERLISGSVNIYSCEFTFDSEWDGYTVTAVFSTGSRLVNMAVVDGKCDIPVEVLRPNARLRIGVFGTDGVRSKPTTYSEWINVEQGADISGNTAQPPTPSVYEQWMNALDEKHDEWEANELERQEAEKERQDLESGYVARAEEAAEVAEEARKAAERARDETQGIAGGDFASTAYVDQKISDAEDKANAYTDKKIEEIPTPDVSGQINTHNTATDSHADIRNAVSEAKATAESLKPTYTATTMLASNWTDHAYSFEADYPHAQYDIEIMVADTATAEQFEAFGAAMLGSSAASNIATAIGEVPTVDIPIIVKAVRK